MLVNISYSVDFDDVPSLVHKFLREDIQKDLATEVLRRIEDSISHMEPGQENVGKVIQTIEEIRSLLIKVDMRLSDCSNILKGYHREILNFGSEEQVEQAEQDNDLSDIQSDILKLREAMATGDINNDDR
jgi:hypothetical protein